MSFRPFNRTEKSGDQTLIPPDEVVHVLPGSRVIAALSGGSDSLALTAALHQWQEKFGFQLEAVHFIHGIRPAEIGESECALCRSFCERLQVPLKVVSLEVPKHRKPGESLEECARTQRLAFWQELAARESGFYLATGHHADDRMENLLIRLFRGSNVSGLTSLRPTGRIGHLRVLHPLLNYHKEELRAYLHRIGITEWAEDATNMEQDTLRNYLRNTVLPDLFRRFPATHSGLLSAADALETDALFLEKHADAAWQEMNPENGNDWRKHEPALRARLMRRYMASQLGEEQLPDRQMLQRFETALAAAERSGEARDIPLRDTDMVLTVHGTKVSLHKKGRTAAGKSAAESAIPALLWNWQKQPELHIGGHCICAVLIKPGEVHAATPDTAFFDADRISAELLIDAIRPGDRMTVFGSGANIKLKKLLTDARIPAEERATLPVMRDPQDSVILWLPGCRNSNCFSCSTETRRVVRFSFRKDI